MRDVIRYSEAFKLRVVEDVARGKYKSLNEALRRNGIRGAATLAKWMKEYGREENVPDWGVAQAARLAAVRLCRWHNPHAGRGSPSHERGLDAICVTSFHNLSWRNTWSLLRYR